MSLDIFVLKINNFNKLAASQKIDYFVYFLTIVEGKEGIKSKEIEDCFDKLRIAKYSNIPLYLKNHSKKSKSKAPKFILQNGLYHLERSKKNEIDGLIGSSPILIPTDNYFPLEIFNNTRGYLQSIAKQAANCYDYGLYDACSVMTRKLLEVLIIETFERHKIAAKIKGPGGFFFYLSDLVDALSNEASWNIGRNAKQSMPNLKKMGDLSAHNRRYFAKKPELDKQKDDLRIVLEELIHLIDYPSWK